ncbi:MAG: thioesterase family protein [Acidobacteria bacterium]|nr:thioesterase family protein [Acidobacteriota bacterium]
MSSPRSERRSAEEQARLDSALIEIFEKKISFNQVLGLKVRQLRPEMVVCFDMRPELVGHFHFGRLHGGVISAALDALGGTAIFCALCDRHAQETPEQALARFSKLGTIDLRVDYLRPGLGSSFVASAEVLRLGGRVGTAQSRLCDEEGLLLATATGAYMVS